MSTGMEHKGPYGFFMAATSYHATCRTDYGDVPLLLELRLFPDGATSWYTIFEDRNIRATYTRGLFDAIPEMLGVAIPHQMTITWQGRNREATIIELLSRDTSAPIGVSIQLQLVLDGQTYTTTPCDVLQDAQLEIVDIAGPEAQLVLQSCSNCIYSGASSPGPGWDDRDGMRCYRDASPQLFEEVVRRGKFASWDAKHSGHYHVSAFHRCAAWQKPGGVELREQERCADRGTSKN